MSARRLGSTVAAAATMTTLIAGAAMAGTIAPYRSHHALTFGNGYGAAVYDLSSARLTTRDLVELNEAVELGGRTPAEAAAAWWDGQVG